nr:NADH dehydrogenase subunit 6 [Pyemotes zhonghuajia]
MKLIFMLIIFYSLQNLNFNEMIILIILICILMSFNTLNMGNFWMGFILFMTFVGGIMILFTFIASNMETKMLKKPHVYFYLILISLFLLNYSEKNLLLSNLPLMMKFKSNTILFLFLMLNLNLFFISKTIKMNNKPFKKI